MRVLLTGGGTGGHITPLLAVGHKLKELDSKTELIYIGEIGGKFSHMTADKAYLFDAQYRIFAGKFRRYHGQSWLNRLFDVKTNLLNARDGFLFCLGFLQSLWLLIKTKPDVILLKGGFVGVPIGLAAALLGKPFVTHDSDALPGLANRIVSRWAKRHATGMPEKYYKYPRSKTSYVGVLVGDDYQKVTPKLMREYRKEIGVPEDGLVMTITGGSHGAVRLNKALAELLPELLDKFTNLYIVHQVGKGNVSTYGSFTHERLIVQEFLKGMHRYTGASDLIITRAGSNTLAELGVQGKACIVAPNPMLTGGHQLKNAVHLQEQKAVAVVDEAALLKDPRATIWPVVEDLLSNAKDRIRLADRLHSITIKDASSKLAHLLKRVAEQRRAGE